MSKWQDIESLKKTLWEADILSKLEKDIPLNVDSFVQFRSLSLSKLNTSLSFTRATTNWKVLGRHKKGLLRCCCRDWLSEGNFMHECAVGWHRRSRYRTYKEGPLIHPSTHTSRHHQIRSGAKMSPHHDVPELCKSGKKLTSWNWNEAICTDGIKDGRLRR